MPVMGDYIVDCTPLPMRARVWCPSRRESGGSRLVARLEHRRNSGPGLLDIVVGQTHPWGEQSLGIIYLSARRPACPERGMLVS